MRLTPLLAAAALACCPSPASATFSIVACDQTTGELGVAVASRVPSVGAGVIFVEPGVGAVARQADGTGSGSEALALLKRGRAPAEVLRSILGAKPSLAHQVGIVDARCRAAVSTGGDTLPWRGHHVGSGLAVQGNILTGPEVVEAMVKAYQQTTGTLAERLLASLEAGDQAGGDRRGRQSAALLVMRKGGGWDDRLVDARVDDHANPVAELRRIVQVRLAWDLVESGEVLLAKGNVNGALPLMQRAAERAPDDTYFQVYLGAVTYLAGRRDDALRILVAARKRDPQFANLWQSHEIVVAFRPVFADAAFVRAMFED